MLCFGGQNNDPFFRGEGGTLFSLLFLSATPTTQCLALEGRSVSSKNPQTSPCVLLLEVQRNKDTNRYVWLLSKTTDVKLGSVFVKLLFYFDPEL